MEESKIAYYHDDAKCFVNSEEMVASHVVPLLMIKRFLSLRTPQWLPMLFDESDNHHNCPFPWGSRPYPIHGSSGPQESARKRHLDRPSRFCTAHHITQTDTPTTLRVTSVAIGRMCGRWQTDGNTRTVPLYICYRETQSRGCSQEFLSRGFKTYAAFFFATSQAQNHSNRG